MKDWLGVPLVFDGATETNSSESARGAAAKDMTGPYGIRMQPDPGCEKGAEYVLKRLVEDYLPAAVRYYGDPFGGKSPSRVFTVKVRRNDGGWPSWGARGDGVDKFTIGLAKGSDEWDMDLTLVANKVLTVCHDDVGFHLYVNDFIGGDVKGIDPAPEIKDFKKNAKYYLCLFSASWYGPCRAEMPRIAKTYAESLKDDPRIELIHFSWDQNDEKALAWAKEHDVKFPVVKPNGGNPLDLRTRGIPHLFIVKADGTLMEEGHPAKLFTDEKLRKFKSASGDVGAAQVR